MEKVFFNVSGRTILLMHGAEALDLLQRISTNDLSTAKPGESIQTVLTNEKGRIVEVISVLERSAENLLVVGQSSGSEDMKLWIEKFIIMEDIVVTDVTSDFSHGLLLDANPSSRRQIAEGIHDEVIFFDETLRDEKLTHVLCNTRSTEAVVANLKAIGYDLRKGDAYEEYRISHGVPSPPHELSLSYNPLEAGLLPLVSWTKGCYIGQEVISRLDSYKKVQRRLVKMHLKDLPTVLPAKLYNGDSECGMITSAMQRTGSKECRGLGYVNTSAELPSCIGYFYNGSERIEVSIEMPRDFAN